MSHPPPRTAVPPPPDPPFPPGATREQRPAPPGTEGPVSTVMLKSRSAATALARRLLATRTRVGCALAAGWRRLTGRRLPRYGPLPSASRRCCSGAVERRAMQHALAGAVRQLRRVAAVPAPHTVAVIVQQSLPAATPGHPLAACTEVRPQPDGGGWP